MLTAATTNLHFLRDTRESPNDIEPRGDDNPDIIPSQIRCPICRWTPERDCTWACGNVDYPEFFYDACGTEWNTFETRGLCPGCSHQWIWTSCFSCFGWSKHEDWYE